jgi:hypothetical protein
VSGGSALIFQWLALLKKEGGGASPIRCLVIFRHQRREYTRIFFCLDTQSKVMCPKPPPTDKNLRDSPRIMCKSDEIMLVPGYWTKQLLNCGNILVFQCNSTTYVNKSCACFDKHVTLLVIGTPYRGHPYLKDDAYLTVPPDDDTFLSSNQVFSQKCGGIYLMNLLPVILKLWHSTDDHQVARSPASSAH